jgi:hypothetical protein
MAYARQIQKEQGLTQVEAKHQAMAVAPADTLRRSQGLPVV